MLPDGRYRVTLENGHNLIAYAGGKLKKNHIRIIAGDEVTLEMSAYDSRRAASQPVTSPRTGHSSSPLRAATERSLAAQKSPCRKRQGLFAWRTAVSSLKTASNCRRLRPFQRTHAGKLRKNAWQTHEGPC